MLTHSRLHDVALASMEADTPNENHAALLQAGYEDLARSYLEAVQQYSRCSTALFQRQLRIDEAGNGEDFDSLLRAHPGYQEAKANKERAWAQVLEVKQQALARLGR